MKGHPAVLAACYVVVQAAVATAQPLTPGAVESLQRGGHVIVLRHATADRVSEPTPIDLADCASQHRLTDAGRDEARALGQAIQALGVPVGTVLSSGYCRAMETARLAFGRAEPSEVLLHPAYVPVPGRPSPPPVPERTVALRRLLASPPPGGTNTVLVSHGENLAAALRLEVGPGEAVIFRPDGDGGAQLVARVPPRGWPTGPRVTHRISQTAEGVAIGGYDAVAYHTEQRAVIGSADFEHRWAGARWRFATAAHRDRFAAEPERYAPQHGGYCNMGLTRGQLLDGNPGAWAILDGRLHLFASERGRDNFRKDTAANLDRAARSWATLGPKD